VIGDFTNIHVGILSTRAGYLRMLLIGLLLQYILQKYPLGILPESRPTASSKT
jgi:branched-chain amino acid transport system permease protein